MINCKSSRRERRQERLVQVFLFYLYRVLNLKINLFQFLSIGYLKNVVVNWLHLVQNVIVMTLSDTTYVTPVLIIPIISTKPHVFHVCLSTGSLDEVPEPWQKR